MSSKKVRLVVSTSSNFRFLTALPADISIRAALPALLGKYKAVVSENIGAGSGLIDGIRVEQITKGGCLIGRDEILGDVLADNDEVEIKLTDKDSHHDRAGQASNDLTKREKL